MQFLMLSSKMFDMSIYFCWGINVFSLENYFFMEKHVSNSIIMIKTFYK